MDDQHGDPLPGVLDAISHAVSAAIWSGITTGYLTLAHSYHVPRKFLPDCVAVTTGGRGGGGGR